VPWLRSSPIGLQIKQLHGTLSYLVQALQADVSAARQLLASGTFSGKHQLLFSIEI
jgi:hypothetical protein